MVIYPPFIALLRDRLNAERGAPTRTGDTVYLSMGRNCQDFALSPPEARTILEALRSMPTGRTYDFREFSLTAQRPRFPMAAHEPRNTHIWIAGLKVAEMIADLESLFPDSWSLPLEYKQALAQLFLICNSRKCRQRLHEDFVNDAFCIR